MPIVLRFVYIFLLAVISVIPVVSHADVDQGYAWLASQQLADGRVVSDPALAHPLQATAESVLAFDTESSAAGLDRDQAIVFIANNSELSTEFVARAVLLGINTNSSGVSLLETLKTHQNPDGGFGYLAGYDSTVIDTAYALDALTSTGITDSPEIRTAVNFIIDQQATNGSYAISTASIDSVIITAQVSQVLQRFLFVYNVSNTLTAASDFLLSTQLASGGWNSSWETASVLMALVPVTTDVSLYQDAAALLVNAQQSDGSWADDVYSTALALSAIHLLNTIQVPVDPSKAVIIRKTC